MKEWMFPALITFISWGLWAFLPKVTIKYVDSGSAIVYQVIGGFIIGIGALIWLKFRVEFNPPGFTFGVITGLVGFFGATTYLIALSKGPLVLVAPLTALYPILAILLGFFVLHEAVTLKQGIGILMSMASIWLISS